MLEDHGASVIMQHRAEFYVALQVELEVGSVSLIERLVQLKSKDIPSYILGHALLTAIREGRDEVAKILFDAGANVRAHPVHESPLLEALKRRNGALVIVLSLLDADADCNIGHHSAKGGETGKSPIQYAVEWGHRSVIEALIFAGANVNACGLKSPSSRSALYRCEATRSCTNTASSGRRSRHRQPSSTNLRRNHFRSRDGRGYLGLIHIPALYNEDSWSKAHSDGSASCSSESIAREHGHRNGMEAKGMSWHAIIWELDLDVKNPDRAQYDAISAPTRSSPLKGFRSS